MEFRTPPEVEAEADIDPEAMEDIDAGMVEEAALETEEATEVAAD
jgi:hypothetical protein